MGIYSRDYIREERPQGLFGRTNEQWAVNLILAANVAVFLLQNMSDDVTNWLVLDPVAVWPHWQVWRLVTYAFCHANLQHIFFNMLGLWIFGKLVEPVSGSREFMGFYLAGCVLAGVVHSVVSVLTGRPAATLGASGGVMAVTVLCAMLFPHIEILFMFVLRMELRWMAVIYVLIDVFGAMGQGGQVAHWAHLGGAAWGFLYKYFGLRLLNFTWPRPKAAPRRRSAPDLKIFEPTAENRAELDRRVDEILQKISQQGEASLSEAERQLLKEASRRYKDR